MKVTNSRLLILNGGSSSIKFALFDAGESPKKILEGAINQIGLSNATLHFNISSQKVSAPNYKIAIDLLIDCIEKEIEPNGFCAIGYRLVHGGPNYYNPTRITEEMIQEIRKFSAFDPMHMPQELLLIETFQARFPKLPHVACFDTAFHHDLPMVAKMLPIPRRYEAEGVRRYGFHGISYQFLMEELSRISKENGKVILAHLGSGSSLTAVSHGKSIDTSMGFTPASGVLMGTRAGDLDPGLVLYLFRTRGLDAQQYNEMVNSKSGLLGISETSSDMQVLLANEANDTRAAEAIGLYCYQVKKQIGAYAAVLGGLDTLVFSGGIGAHSPTIRTRICEGLNFLGISLNEGKNGANKPLISNGPIEVRVIQTDEEWMIAKTLCQILQLN